jgi:hypothetical protein
MLAGARRDFKGPARGGQHALQHVEDRLLVAVGGGAEG